MPGDLVRAERPRRCHRLLAQRGHPGYAHRPALGNTDRSQPDSRTEHRQPDGRADHGLDRAKPHAEQLVHLNQRI